MSKWVGGSIKRRQLAFAVLTGSDDALPDAETLRLSRMDVTYRADMPKMVLIFNLRLSPCHPNANFDASPMSSFDKNAVEFLR